MSRRSGLERRLHQQEIVADLGQHALETDDLDSLMHEACVAVADTLNNEYCKVLERLPGGDALFLRQGVGWRDGLVGSGTVPTDRDSQAGYTLIREEPVIVEDLQSESRFSGPELLTNHDVVSGISVIIGSVEEPWGVLGTHSTDRRTFTDHDAAFVQSVANVLASAIERTEKERENERLLDLLRHTEQAATVGGWEVHRDPVDVFWSEELFDILGIEGEEEPTVETVLEMIHEEDRERVADAFARAIDAGDPFDLEARAERRDGAIRWLHIQGEPIFEDGNIAAVRGVTQDITDRKERERARARANRRTELALETTNATVWEWDPRTDTVQTHPNPHGLFQETVHSSDDFLGAIHPDDRERVERRLERAVETGSPFHVEYRFRRKGSVRWAEDYGEILDRPDDDGVRMIGVTYDITERKDRERKLERYKRAVEASGHAIYMTDPDGEITYVNPAFEEITDYDASDAIGKTPRILQSNEHDEGYYRELWETVRAGDVWEEEITDRRKDGSVYYAQQTIAPVTDGNGEIDRFVAVQHDITERKERQRALAESERRYRALVDHFPNGAVALFDDDLRYTAAGGDLLEEMDIGDPTGDRIDQRYPDDLVEDVEPHFKAALEGEEREFEVEFADRHLLARTLPIRSSTDEIYGGMLVVLDITEERESQRRLQASHERLEEFATAVSHDLREPLGTVASYLQLLERRYEEDLDEDAQEFIEFAVSGATRMREMIDGLLTTYAQVEVGGTPFEPVDLDAVLDDVLVDLSRKIEESDAEITAEPLPTVEGDRGQLRQVLMNLVDNAIKYSGTDRPRIHVSAVCDDDLCRVAVEDEGIGIDEAASERIFDVFTRVHSRDEYAGTGIGLALCDRIVERHGGEIVVDSEPGEGSTFTFTVPANPDVER